MNRVTREASVVSSVSSADGAPVLSSLSRAGNRTRIRNAMTVDVEDFFQVQAFASTIDRADWDNWPRRVEASTDKVLALFSEHEIKGTFFCLGWVAERHPNLIRRIVEQGHELASHGYAHIPVYEQKPEEFRVDVRRTKGLLEDIAGVAIRGYRAASFSISEDTLWALSILAEEGYAYSSSIYPVVHSSSIYPVVHDLYGMPRAPRFAFRPRCGGFVEIPMTTVRLLDRNLPWSGGGFFRLLPYTLSRWGLRRVNVREQQPVVFYFHPWELDVGQPRLAGLPLKSRVRHYLNLGRTETRLRCLMADFAWGRMDQVFLGVNV